MNQLLKAFLLFSFAHRVVSEEMEINYDQQRKWFVVVSVQLQRFTSCLINVYLPLEHVN